MKNESLREKLEETRNGLKAAQFLVTLAFRSYMTLIHLHAHCQHLLMAAKFIVLTVKYADCNKFIETTVRSFRFCMLKFVELKLYSFQLPSALYLLFFKVIVALESLNKIIIVINGLTGWAQTLCDCYKKEQDDA